MDSMKIFFATAFGAFIGAIVAMSFSPSFWWIGLIPGGLVGYLSYEFKKVKKTIPLALLSAKNALGQIKLSSINWGRIGKYIEIQFYFIFFATTLFLLGLIFSWTLFSSAIVPKYDSPFNPWILLTLFDLLLSFVASFPVTFAIGVNNTRVIKELREMAIRFNGIAILIYWLPKGIWKSKTYIWAAIKFTGYFLKALFIQIHSEKRLICFCDAAIGSAIGYYFGNPLIGAVSGGLLGVLNYHIVSVKILKLVPQ